MIRLQKFIADCGVTSRRKAEQLIVGGRVSINGQTVTELGTKIDPQNDTIMVDGETIDLGHVNKIYMVMHKPRGVMTTLNDPEGRATVLDLCREISERIYPVGRLDYLSEGLLLLTNDGEFANMIMHPKFEIMKVYEVKVFGAINEGLLRKLQAGVQDPEVGFIKPKSVRVVKQLPTKTWLEFRLGDGKNREIRRLCDALGITIDKLKRVAIEGLSVDGVAPGKYRLFTKKKLLEALGLNADGTKNTKTTVGRFISSKRTIDLARKGTQMATPADSEEFQKFKKDTYYTSLKAIAETKKLAEETAIKEKFAAKEQAHQDRKYRKQKREEKKSEGKNYVHAKFVK